MRLISFSISKLLCVVFALLSVSAAATSSYADFRPGRDAYLRGEFGQAYELFLPSALYGSTKSRIGLGLLAARGHGMDTDYVRAYSWFDMAVAEGQDEHIVVQILARTNREYLAKHMTAEQIEKAKLHSAMTRAISAMPVKPEPARIVRAQMVPALVKPVKASLNGEAAIPSKAVTVADTEPSKTYRIQLDALRSGHSTDLIKMWRILAKRYSVLKKTTPSVVRVDLEELGVYDSLWAGPFATSSDALAACAVLMKDNRDCLVAAN